jgi:hypothetical protein
MNAKIVFGPVNEGLRENILSKLDKYYQNTEVVESTAEAAQPGFNPVMSLFGNQSGGKKSFLSFLLTPKKIMKKKTMKKLSKKSLKYKKWA